MTTPPRRSRRAASTVIAAALALSALGCNDDSGDALPPAASAAGDEPTSTIDPEHREILDVYHGSVAAMVAAQAAGDPDHPDLERYFGGNTPALFDVREGIERQVRQGTMYEGDLEVVDAEVTGLDVETDPPEATIGACLDDSDYVLVDRDDGSPVPASEPGGRYTVTSTASKGPDDNWYIIQSTAHWDEPC